MSSLNVPGLSLYNYDGTRTVLGNPPHGANERFRVNIGFGGTLPVNGRPSQDRLDRLLGSAFQLGQTTGQNGMPSFGVQQGNRSLADLDRLLTQNIQAPSLANGNLVPGFGNTNSSGQRSTLTVEGILSQFGSTANQDFNQQLNNMIRNAGTYDILTRNGVMRVTTDGSQITDTTFIRGGGLQQQRGNPLIQRPVNDQTDITTRAAAKDANGVPTVSFSQLVPPGGNVPGQNPFSPEPRTNAFAIDAAQAKKAGLQAGQGTQTPQAVRPPDNNPFKALGNLENNPVLKALPAGFNDAKVTGADAEVDFRQSRNLGAVNAGYGVEKTSAFQDQFNQLRNNLAQLAYQDTAKRSAEAREKMMPVTAFVPSGSTPSTGSTAASAPLNTLDMTMADSANKQSSGGSYMPLFQNPGQHSSGSGQQQQQQPRKRLTAVA